MSKRFTETDKWRDPWFRKLTPLQKCLFVYLCENCNNAGFIEIDLEAWSFPISCNHKDLEGAWQGLGRGLVVSSGWAWIRNFLRHQKHLPLIPKTNPAHRQITKLFHEQELRFPGLLDAIISGSPTQGASVGLDSPTGEGEGIGIGIGEGSGPDGRNVKRPGQSGTDHCGKHFAKPTASEVTEYAASIHFELDGQTFVDHYDANGWRIGGKSPMKNWQAAVRTWKNRRNEKQTTSDPTEGAR